MKKNHFWTIHLDYSIIGIVFTLLMIGILSVYVAVSHDYPKMVWPFLGQQLAWIGVGCIICLIVTIFSTKFLWKITPFLYLLGLALMVLPLVFYNPNLVASTGAKNWVAYGNITFFQPSEFMKIPFILMLSRSIVRFLQRNKGRERLLRQDWFLILELTIYTIPVFALLALQQDLGTALVFLAIFAGLVLVSGVSWKIILPVILLLAGGLAGFLFFFLSEGGRAFLHQQVGMPTYQMNRILAWLNPFDYAQTTTYQQAQGQLAIASGGLFGQGFNVSNLLVPVRESDMIFTVVAEDFGFVGALVLLILYVTLIYRILKITLQSNNQFYTYISIGFIMMLVFHIFENVGAVTGLLPLTGIPLPFISQGGSSIISNLIGIGLVLSIYNHSSKKKEPEDGPPIRKKVVLKKAQ